MLTRIGKYEVQSRIGEGGFGRVYLAHDSSVDRPVAIKILNAKPAPELLAQFRTEARTTANLRHENIVIVHDFGEHQGIPYLVMEYLEGQNLETAIQVHERLSLLDKIHLLTQTAEGLHYAHQKKIVHRDVKPANIMLLPSGSVKVMDFGIANIINLSATRETGRHSITGTARYMAPEQFAGSPADVQTDIFSFGCVCYECISGTHPFHFDGEDRVMFGSAARKPEALNQVCGDCPEILAAVVDRALAFDRDVRYQSLEDVMFDMKPVLLEVKRKHARRLMTGYTPSGESENDEAFLKRVLDLDPSHEDAGTLLKDLRDKNRSLTIRRRIEEHCVRGGERLRARDFGGAIESFESALRGDGSLPEAIAGLEEARSGLSASRSCARLLSNARREASAGNIASAFLILDEGLALDPENDQAIGFRRELTVFVAVGQSRELRDHKAFDAAESVLNELGKLLQDTIAQKELADIRRDRDLDIQERRRKDFESRRASLEDERAAGDWEAAIAIAEQACQAFPEHQEEMSDLVWELREEQAAAKRAKAIQDAIRTGESLLEDAKPTGDWEAALRHLENASTAFPKSPELQALRILAEAAIRERDSLKEWNEIKSRVGSILRTGPGDAISSLLAVAETHGARPDFPSVLDTARIEAAFHECLEEIRGYIRNEDWRKAGALLEASAARNPERDEIDKLAAEIVDGQRSQRARQAAARVRKAIQEGDFLGAGDLLNRTASLPGFNWQHAELKKELTLWQTAAQRHSCPKCETTVAPDARFCDNCGARLPVHKNIMSESVAPSAPN